MTVNGPGAPERIIGGRLRKPPAASEIRMGNDVFQLKVGDCNCLIINDRDDWDCFALVVETGQQRVLIDTGCGWSASPPGRLLARLEAAGLSAAEIDVVVFSHADCDHVGGA